MGCRNSPAFLLSKLFINVIARTFSVSAYQATPIRSSPTLSDDPTLD
jgi:hypothetical protein